MRVKRSLLMLQLLRYELGNYQILTPKNPIRATSWFPKQCGRCRRILELTVGSYQFSGPLRP